MHDTTVVYGPRLMSHHCLPVTCLLRLASEENEPDGKRRGKKISHSNPFLLESLKYQQLETRQCVPQGYKWHATHNYAAELPILGLLSSYLWPR